MDSQPLNPFHFGQRPETQPPEDEGDGQTNRRYNRSLSRHDIGNQSRFLLSQFIHDRMVADGIVADVPQAEELIEPGTPTGPPLDRIRDVANALKIIGDELNNDERLNRLIARMNPQDTGQTFSSVARELFSDGVYNWGRVVALFYFAYKMVLKSIQQRLNDIPFLRSIVEWTVNFIIDYLAQWIIERGGWEAIQEYFGSTTLQAVAVFLSGAVFSICVVLWRLRS